MRITDRFGKSFDEYRRAHLARLRFKVDFDARLTDQDGKVWPIPPAAIRDRQRSTAVDSGTWEIKLSLYPGKLPKGLIIEQYQTLTIDRLIAGVWPYFTGKIDEPVEDIVEENGAAVRTLELTAQGVLQRCKGYRINSLNIDPLSFFSSILGTAAAPADTALSFGDSTGLVAGEVLQLASGANTAVVTIQSTGFFSVALTGAVGGAFTYPIGSTVKLLTQLLGICTTQQKTVTSTMAIGGVESVPGAAVTYALNDTAVNGGLVISPNADFSGPYVKGVAYTLDATVSPAKVTWLVVPAATRYYRYAKLERFVAPRIIRAAAKFFRLPYRRDVNDLYQTTIAAIDTGAKTITPSDPTGYKDLLDVAQGEYLTVTPASGIDVSGQITAVDASTGAMTFAALPAGAALGDSIRLGTSDYHQAWDDDRLITIYSNSLGTVLYDQRYFQTMPNIGQAVPVSGRHWTSSEGAWAFIGLIREVQGLTGIYSNRIEEAVKTVLTSATGLFSAADFTVERTGVLIKNISRAGITMDEFLKEIKEQSLNPSDFLHDTMDGKLTLKPYYQKATPDWELRGVRRIRIEPRPEPVTAVTIIGKDEPANNAAIWFLSSENLTSPDYMFDGSVVSPATPPSSASPSFVTFRLPPVTPLQAYPVVDKIRITGVGVISVFVSFAGQEFYLPGYIYRSVGKTGSQATLEIPGEELIKIVNRNSSKATSPTDLVLRLDNTMAATTIGTAIAEIEILVKNQTAWRAELTDDPAKCVVPADTTQFGTIWTAKTPPSSTGQEGVSEKVSYRYAPTSYLKRVQVRYVSPSNQVPRHEVRELTGITIQDARNYAERYQDEHLRMGSVYVVEAPLLDYAEPGDTGRVWTPWGTSLSLFLQGLSDGGGPLDNMANYRFIDYSK